MGWDGMGTGYLVLSILVNGRRDQLPGPVLFDRRDNGATPVYLVIPGPVYVVHGPVSALVQIRHVHHVGSQTQ